MVRKWWTLTVVCVAGTPAAGRPDELEVAIHSAFAGAMNEIRLVGAIIAFTGALLGLVPVRGSDFFVATGAPPRGPDAAPAAV